jgi:hypothetical protein
LVFHFLISLSTVFICRSSWILWLFMYQGAFRMDRRDLVLKRWRISMLELEAVHHSWIPLSTALYRRNLLSIDSLIFRVVSAFVSLFGWAVFLCVWCALPMSDYSSTQICWFTCDLILSRFRGATTDGVWIGEEIYLPLVYTTRDYTLQMTDTHRQAS